MNHLISKKNTKKHDRQPVMDAGPFIARSREQLSQGASVCNSVMMFFHFLFLESQEKIAQSEAQGLLFPPLV